ncbi:MAG: MATE family efflux transporter [Clostridia bacterium]|nr:MATE family efflux transporter [Clostridia bacterium]
MKANRFFGDKAFYKLVLAVSVPIMVQMGITNFVNMLDNVMVGRLGTDPMSGVAIVGQFFFVFNITMFGGISGASIFGAQFHGSGNSEGVRDTFRFRLMLCTALTVLAIGVLLLFGDALISLYLHEGGETGDLEATRRYARDYLNIIFFTMPPFAISMVYSSVLKDTGETLVPMKAALSAVFINLGLNYLLIFGKFGFPMLGVKGAAIATAIARFIECGFLVNYTHKHVENCPFIIGAYESMRVPKKLTLDITKSGLPLLINEILWASGIATLTQCYSTRGLAVVAANNISSTITNVFNVVFLSMGSAIAIIVGNKLGAGKMEEAKLADSRLITFNLMVTTCIAGIMALCSTLIPQIYETTAEVRLLARDFLRIMALFMPMHAYMHSAYFTMRSGGKTILTFLFDSGFMWVVCIPVAYCLAHFTALPIRPLFLIVSAVEAPKCIIGAFLLKKGTWLNNLVKEQPISD